MWENQNGVFELSNRLSCSFLHDCMRCDNFVVDALFETESGSSFVLEVSETEGVETMGVAERE